MSTPESPAEHDAASQDALPQETQPQETQPPETQPQQEVTADAVDVPVEAVEEEHESATPDIAPVGPAPSPRRRSRRRPRPRRSSWPLLAPAVVVLLALTVWPLGLGVWNALRRSSLSVPDDDAYVGLANVTEILASRQWWVAVSATLLLVAVAVLTQLVLAAGVAASLRRVVVPRPVRSVLLLAPFALLPVVTAASWRTAVTDGPLAVWFGYDGESTTAALVAVVVTEVWRGTGITALILLVGLRRVDDSLLESVRADGATAFQRLRRVTWPAVAPAVAVAVLFRSLDVLRSLEAPLLAEGSTTLRTVPLLVWDTTFDAFEVGLGAAMSLLLIVLAALVAAVVAVALRPGRRT